MRHGLRDRPNTRLLVRSVMMFLSVGCKTDEARFYHWVEESVACPSVEELNETVMPLNIESSKCQYLRVTSLESRREALDFDADYYDMDDDLHPYVAKTCCYTVLYREKWDVILAEQLWWMRQEVKGWLPSVLCFDI